MNWCQLHILLKSQKTIPHFMTNSCSANYCRASVTLKTKGKYQTIHRKMITGLFYWWQLTCKLQAGYSLFLIQRTEGTSIHHWSCHTALHYSMHKPLKPHPTNLFTSLPSFLKTHITSSSLQECGT
jgi:hypothetical protein